jgi:hypothetical protein
MTLPKLLRLFPRVGVALLLAAGPGLTGCGPSQATVSGKVTYQGTPLTTGTVTFLCKGDKSVSCSISPTGEYTLTKVPVGPAKIGVFTPPAVPENMAGKVPEASGGAAGKPVAIPASFSDPKSSGLEYTVTAGAQQHPIDLK